MKHLVPLLLVAIHRDITSTPHCQVPEHEIPILKLLHGEDNVFVREKTGANTALDLETELDRMHRKYGKEAVFDAYGARAEKDIRRTILEESVGTVEDDTTGIQLEGPDSKPGAPVQQKPAPAAKIDEAEMPNGQWSKGDLVEWAAVRGISVDQTQTKASILEAITRASVPA